MFFNILKTKDMLCCSLHPKRAKITGSFGANILNTTGGISLLKVAKTPKGRLLISGDPC